MVAPEKVTTESRVPQGDPTRVDCSYACRPPSLALHRQGLVCREQLV